MNTSCIEAGTTYECAGCLRGICGDCAPSPGEADRMCADCSFTATTGEVR